jgi:imidazoleglycerol-phosphate dehydratase/histidinol-phosphatase
MKNIFIEAAIISFDSPASQGLISGLSALQSAGCKLFTDAEIPVSVKTVFASEGISFKTTTTAVTMDYFVNTGKKGLTLNKETKVETFGAAAKDILARLRSSVVVRNTKETQITVEVALDSKKESAINTGIGFFDHMLDQIARHGNIYLSVKVKGDLHVDEHHTVEDTGIALGMAIAEALGSKKGIKRYGFLLPMDDSIAYCALDLGGRAYLKFKAKFSRELVGEFPTELVEEFFRALSSGLKANIYLKVKGDNDHHKIEALFKAFAKALNDAIRIDPRAEGALPSTKGVL